jgi:competence protein ComEC
VRRFNCLLNHHLLAALTLSFILGLAISSTVNFEVDKLLTGIIVSALCLIFCYWRLQKAYSLLTALLLFLLTGLYLGNISSRLPDSQTHIYSLLAEPADAVIIGQLVSMVTFNGDTSQALIQLESVKMSKPQSYIATRGKLLLRLTGPWPADIIPGTHLAIRATIKRPSRYLTPGTFDYPAYLARKDIWVTGYIRSTALIQPLQRDTTLIDQVTLYPEKLRGIIGNFIDNRMPDRLGSIYRAILIGDRSKIPDQTLENFKTSGTMHILAISGIHLTLIGTLLFTSIYWLLRRSEYLALKLNVRKTAGILCLPLLFSYALLAGMNSPVFRACLMSSIIILAFCTNRPKTLSSLIAFAALVILTHCPQALFTPSFQLSFAAFTAIMLTAPFIKEKLSGQIPPNHNVGIKVLLRIKNWTLASLVAASVAVLGTAPIVLFYFYRFPLAGPLANLILEPLICLWALPFGVIALPFLYILPDFASLLFHLGGVGLEIALKVTETFHAFPQMTLWLPPPKPLLISLYYVTFIYALSAFTHSRLTCAAIRSVPFLICLSLLLMPQLRFDQKNINSPIISILDVGQGSATVMQFPDGTNILIDGGGSSFSKETVGERIIAPFLWNLGITRLDSIIITHPDADHYNGIPFLIRHFSPSLLWTHTLDGGDRHYRDLLALAQAKGLELRIPHTGDTITNGEASVTCLANGWENREAKTSKNSGLVLQVLMGNHRILFPGDIENNTEANLVEHNVPVASNILIAAHHGSATSNSTPFLLRVNPEAIIASSGQSRKDYFPSENLRKYCQSQRLPLLVTAEVGTIRIAQQGNTTELFIHDLDEDNPLRRNPTYWIPAQRLKSRSNDRRKQED